MAMFFLVQWDHITASDLRVVGTVRKKVSLGPLSTAIVRYFVW